MKELIILWKATTIKWRRVSPQANLKTFTHNLRMVEANYAEKYKNVCSEGAHTDINVMSP